MSKEQDNFDNQETFENSDSIEFIDGVILVNEVEIEAKKDYRDLTADVYVVPLEYRESGYFVGYRTENGTKEIPSSGTFHLIGSVEVPADDEEILKNEKARKITVLNTEYERCTKFLESTYPESERASWAVQSLEAAAYYSNHENITPWLDAAAESRGVSRSEMAELISGMDSAYRVNHGNLTGIRQRLRNDIDTAQDLDELQEIDLITPLKEAKQEMLLNL